MIAVLVVLSRLGVNILTASAPAPGRSVSLSASQSNPGQGRGDGPVLPAGGRLPARRVLDVGVAKGTVEAISIRSMKLRHHRGPLNTVPFGLSRHADQPQP